MQIFESHQLLVESTDQLSGTGSTRDNYWIDLELAHGTVCDIYTCYTSHDEPFRTTPVTCTVVGKQDHGLLI